MGLLTGARRSAGSWADGARYPTLHSVRRFAPHCVCMGLLTGARHSAGSFVPDGSRLRRAQISGNSGCDESRLWRPPSGGLGSFYGIAFSPHYAHCVRSYGATFLRSPVPCELLLTAVGSTAGKGDINKAFRSRCVRRVRHRTPPRWQARASAQRRISTPHSARRCREDSPAEPMGDSFRAIRG